MQRRVFLIRGASWVVGSTLLAELPVMRAADQAAATLIAEDDPRIQATRVAITTDWGKLDCYLARRSTNLGSVPGVIVAHDKFGLTPHVEDVARRLALEGFIGLAPDYASRFGGTPNEAGPALEVVSMEDSSFFVADTRIGIDWLRSTGGSGIKIGALGFGFGATAINLCVTRVSDLAAAVTFYGHPPPIAEVGHIKASLLLNFAERDQFVAPEIAGFVDALKKTGANYEIFVYENTERGFDDDTAPAHYSPKAADLAWSRSVSFLRETLI